MRGCSSNRTLTVSDMLHKAGRGYRLHQFRPHSSTIQSLLDPMSLIALVTITHTTTKVLEP
jgi:hypothetical protein